MLTPTHPEEAAVAPVRAPAVLGNPEAACVVVADLCMCCSSAGAVHELSGTLLPLLPTCLDSHAYTHQHDRVPKFKRRVPAAPVHRLGIALVSKEGAEVGVDVEPTHSSTVQTYVLLCNNHRRYLLGREAALAQHAAGGAAHAAARYAAHAAAHEI